MMSLSKCHLHAWRHMVSLEKRFQFACRTSYGVLAKVLSICLYDVIRCPWQNAFHLSIWCYMMSLSKCHLHTWRHKVSLQSASPFACMTSYGVLSKCFPFCLYDVIWCPCKVLPFLPVGRQIVSLAKCFPFAYSKSYHVLGKMLSICLYGVIWCHCQSAICMHDVIRCPWQSEFHLPVGRHMVSLAKWISFARRTS